jgi:phosphoribosyl 1,2-cyclic phosphodiesterase
VGEFCTLKCTLFILSPRMSLFIASLNSGSNGNCYYIGNGSEAVLVDAGISCRETEKRMAKLGLEMEHVKAIFISHEHRDHISGLPVLAKKYRLPVYISEATLRHSGMFLPQELTHHFRTEPVNIGGLRVTAFEKLHDAADPYSFIIEGNGIKIGVLTDIGKACKQVVHYFRQCHAVFLETNYDEQMLAVGGYPLHLKKRISGGLGHLSNVQALQLFANYRAPFLSHLILSHLSKNNNHPDKALGLFSPYTSELTIAVASRHCESQVYHIQHCADSFSSRKNLLPFHTVQFSLFE